jgi:hypothetical protein
VLIPFVTAADFMKDVLPVEAATNHETPGGTLRPLPSASRKNAVRNARPAISRLWTQSPTSHCRTVR